METLPIVLACHDMKVLEVKLEVVIDNDLGKPKRQRGGEVGDCKGNFNILANESIKQMWLVLQPVQNLDKTISHKNEILGNNSKSVIQVYWGLQKGQGKNSLM